MKKVSGIFCLICLLNSCGKNESLSEFTGKQTTYALEQTAQYNVAGTAIFKEKRDGSMAVVINVTGVSGSAKYPVHLHLGDLSTQGASVAALLTPLAGQTGKSETTVTKLADETPISYSDLAKLEACIKIHLSDVGPEKDIVLAAANIGVSAAKQTSSGRLGIATCKSN